MFTVFWTWLYFADEKVILTLSNILWNFVVKTQKGIIILKTRETPMAEWYISNWKYESLWWRRAARWILYYYLTNPFQQLEWWIACVEKVHCNTSQSMLLHTTIMTCEENHHIKKSASFKKYVQMWLVLQLAYMLRNVSNHLTPTHPCADHKLSKGKIFGQ